MHKEIETKFKIKAPSDLRKRLNKVGASFVSKCKESDTYYRNFSSNKNIEAIRLRSIGKEGVFTVKEYDSGKKNRIYKIRKEHEVKISDSKAFASILYFLGFKPVFRKEKIRETYLLEGAKILLDKLPFIGFYLEIEGQKQKIKDIAKALELNLDNALAITYIDIFNEYKRKYNIKKGELIFSNVKKK